ncbi:MAG: hypothetical protein IIZ94_01620 [Prevotella sp.]|nr:hypothetical protein [Prevotella sp.]
MTQGSTSIFPFASGSGANVVTDAQWQTLLNEGSLATGFVQGLAQSAQVNKALRQASSVTAGVAQFLADQGNNVTDSLTQQQIAKMLKNAIVASISTSNVSGYIQAWQSSVANNGVGYPKYAVVADPVDVGILYMSAIDGNTAQPSPTSDSWIVLPPNRIVSVASFGVVNDPNQKNVNANTKAFLNAVESGIALYIPSGLKFYVNETVSFSRCGRLIVDGSLNFIGSGYDTAILLNSDGNFVLEGGGEITGSCEVGLDAKFPVIVKGLLISGFSQYGMKASSGNSCFIGAGFNNAGYGLYLDGAKNIVASCIFNDGLYLNSGEVIMVQGCQFNKCTQQQAIVNNPGQSLSNVSIQNCYFYESNYSGISLSGTTSVPIYNISVEKCHFFMTGLKAASSDIYINNAQQVFVSDNISNGCSNIATNLSSGSSISAFVCLNLTNFFMKSNIIINPGQLNGRTGYGAWLENIRTGVIKDNIINNINNTLLAPIGGTVDNSVVCQDNYYNGDQFTISTPNTNGALGIGLSFPNIGVGLRKSGSDIISHSGVFSCNYNGNWYHERYSAIFKRTEVGWLTMQTLWFPGNGSTCNSPFSYSPWGDFSVYWTRLWRFPFTSILIDQSVITEMSTFGGYAQSVFTLDPSSPPNLEFGTIGLRNDDAGANDPYAANYYSAFLRCVGITKGSTFDYASEKGWTNFSDQVDNQTTISPPINGGA